LFFYDPLTQLSRHLLQITAIERQFVSNLLIRYIQSHEVQTQYPHFQRLMMGLYHGVGHFRPLDITPQRRLLAYHFIAMRHGGLCQVF
jgi:hypothetical protein